MDTVLIVDDSVMLINYLKDSFKIYKDEFNITTALDGLEAIEILKKNKSISLLVTDLQMPRVDGLTVLKHIREDEELRRLPVIILTTSREEEDRLRSYDLGANAYIVKPVGFQNFSEAVRTISLFWKLVELPE